jgi:hypothetical protein
MKKFVIHSESEQGFWQMDFGWWVFNIKEATQFVPYSDGTLPRLPLSKNKDAEWIIANYGDV